MRSCFEVGFGLTEPNRPSAIPFLIPNPRAFQLVASRSPQAMSSMSLSQSLSRDPEAPELDIFLHMESLISNQYLAAGKRNPALLQPAVLTHHQNISGADEFAHSVSCSSTLWTTKDQEEENLVQQCLPLRRTRQPRVLQGWCRPVPRLART